MSNTADGALVSTNALGPSMHRQYTRWFRFEEDSDNPTRQCEEKQHDANTCSFQVEQRLKYVVSRQATFTRGHCDHVKLI